MKGDKRLLLLLSLFLLCFASEVLGTHGQRWSIFGKTFELESVWMEDKLNQEMEASVHLIRSDIIKRHHGVKIKLLSDDDKANKKKEISIVLSVFDRNMNVFVDQPEKQVLPSVVGTTSVIKMSEFWGAQNYGPIIFYFHDGEKGAEIESKIMIVISGGKQKTKDKMKERLKSGLTWIQSLRDFDSDSSSDLSPKSDGSAYTHDGKEEVDTKFDPDTKFDCEVQYSPVTTEFHPFVNPFVNDPNFNWYDQSQYLCPNAPVKFMDLLQQDWFTSLEPPDSTIGHNSNRFLKHERDDFEPIRLDPNTRPGKKIKREENPPSVVEAAGTSTAPSVEEANQHIKGEDFTSELYEIDDELLGELESEFEEGQRKELTL